MRKIKSLDDIYWRPVILPSSEIIKILEGKKTALITRERYKRRWLVPTKFRFYKKNYLFVREPWCRNPENENEFWYEIGGKHSVPHWNPPQLMPREAGRLFLRVINNERKRIQNLTPNDIRGYGFNTRDEFVLYWNSRYWRPNDKYEANPMVKIYRFKRITVKKYGTGPVIKPKSYAG